ncbi:MAG: hypothetical protein ACQESF_06975 [Nanobdellota archaeon]
MILNKIRRWFLLRRARKEAKKHIPTEGELREEHKRFMNYTKKLQGRFGGKPAKKNLKKK